MTPQSGWRLRVKRAIDISIAAAAMVILSPIFGAIALAVRRSMGRPVAFSQERLGHRGHRFRIFKFRTMTDQRDSAGALLPDAERLTRLGKLLRSSSLDELPELVNVLRGEMSLVGPRPFMAQYEGLYSADEFRRHDVLPGITGWAQVNGRNDLTWEERFVLDRWYVDHWTLGLDLRILVRTLVALARREGIAHSGHVTSPLFVREPPEAGK